MIYFLTVQLFCLLITQSSLDLNQDVLELGFFVLSAVNLGCRWQRFEVVLIDLIGFGKMQVTGFRALTAESYLICGPF